MNLGSEQRCSTMAAIIGCVSGGRMIRSVGIFAKPHRERIGSKMPELVRWLRGQGIEVFCDRFAAEFAGGGAAGLAQEELMARIELLVVLGGDGTLLTAAHAASEHDVPILPVNFGNLGFLTTVALDELYVTLEQVLAGECETWSHMMLEVEVSRDGRPIEQRRGLNDAVLTKGLPAHMIDFELLVDDVFVCSFRADGIIFSTPTGSTAYSLSAGGPILHPSLGAIVIVPICPHTLSDRPIVVSSDSVIEVVLTGGNQNVHATFDGQEMFSLNDNDHVFIRRSETPVKLIHPSGRSHYDVLRAKLHWGEKF